MYSNKKSFRTLRRARMAPLLYIFKKIEMNDESNKQCTQT